MGGRSDIAGNAEALHLTIEGGAVNVQHPGCLGFVSTGTFKDIDDFLFFTDVRGQLSGSYGLLWSFRYRENWVDRILDFIREVVN